MDVLVRQNGQASKMQMNLTEEGRRVTETKETKAPSPKEKLKAEIIKLVRYFEDSFALGVKYKIISQKHYKAADRAGFELREIINELVEEKQLYTYMNETGAILVLVPEMSELIQQDEYGLITEEAKEILKSKWSKG